MDYRIKLAPGHYSGADAILLTTDRAESSHGIPVAVLVGGPNSGMAFGPSDAIPTADPNDPLAWLDQVVGSAATVVAAAESAARRADGRAAVWDGDDSKPQCIKDAAPYDEAYERFMGWRSGE